MKSFEEEKSDFDDAVYKRTYTQGYLVVRTSCEAEARQRMQEQQPLHYDENLLILELKPNLVFCI